MILILGLRFLRSLGLVVFLVFPLLVFGLVRPIFPIIWVLMIPSRVRRERIFLDCYSEVSCGAQGFSRLCGVVGFGLPQCLIFFILDTGILSSPKVSCADLFCPEIPAHIA